MEAICNLLSRIFRRIAPSIKLGEIFRRIRRFDVLLYCKGSDITQIAHTCLMRRNCAKGGSPVNLSILQVFIFNHRHWLVPNY